MLPQLQPIRPRDRFGIDRGWIVGFLIVALLAVSVIKPWESPPEEEGGDDVAAVSPSPQLNPSPRRQSPTAVAPASPDAQPAPDADNLSLDSVVAALEVKRRFPDSAWVVSVMRPEPMIVPLRASAPESASLGAGCAGGVLLGEGTSAIGVTLPGATRPSRVTRVLLRRLFDGLPPVEVPVSAAPDDVHGVALIAAAEQEWAPGHYALTLDVMGGSGTMTFCVGRMFRAVDYSLIIYVPDSARTAVARAELVSELGRP